MSVTIINPIIGGSGGSSVETVDCIRYTYHQTRNKIIIPCSNSAVNALNNGKLNASLIPTWRSSSSQINLSPAFMQQACIQGIIILASSVSQIWMSQGGSTVSLTTMQNERNNFTYGSNDYSGQGSTGTNISITYTGNSFNLIDTIIGNQYLRWQAILCY